MGKKRQKVQWFPVDNLDWANGEEAESSQSGGSIRSKEPPHPRSRDKMSGAHAQQRRTSGSGWGSACAVAPRFERRVTEPEQQQENVQGDTQTIFYDGELCEAETLPNGFTKIRSKNLDILFKREYYEQRIASQKQLSEELSKNNAANNKTLDKETTPGATTIPGYNDNVENVSEKDMVASNTESDSATLDKIDPDEIREFKPMNHGLETPLPEMESGQTSPFHPGYGNGSSSSSGYPPNDPEVTGSSEAAGYMAPGGRAANLYLYSPSNNTLIPCEEIIIPNPVVSPDTGEAMYTGPTNIYLAYPVQGPDGRSYITQPFPMEQGYQGTGYPGYSHSMSYESSNYYSSTPHTPNSGEDSGSGSSTQPTSPPPLVNFHPSNWFKPDAMLEAGPGVQETEELPEFTPLSTFHHFSPASPKLANSRNFSQETEAVAVVALERNAATNCKTLAPAVTEKVINASEKSSRLNSNGSGSGSVAATPSPSSTITYIPGLPQEQMVQSAKTQKKRKKKSKPKAEKCNSEDSSITFEFDTSSPPVKDEDQSPELDTSVPSTEQVYEIQLTDDLADSLVNPPTDPEISEEEEIRETSVPIVHPIQSNTGTEIEIDNSEPITEAVTPPTTDNAELVDREVRDITQMIHSESPSVQDNTDITESTVTKPTNIIEKKEEEVAATPASMFPQIDSQPKNEGAIKTEKKSKNKKPKKGSSNKSVRNSGDEEMNKIAKEEPVVEVKSAASPVLAAAPQVSSNENKKSWSSVIKSTLPPPSSVEPASEPVASPKPEKKATTGGSKKENSAEQRAKRRNAAEEKKKKKSSIERSDSWENIPVSVTQQEDSWEKTAKKGKKKSKRKTEDSRKEKVTFEKEEASVAEETLPVTKTEPVVEKVSVQDPSPEAEITSAEAETEAAKEEAEADTEKRKLKKRRKKADSGEPEEAANSHRVLICDEQLQLQYVRELRAVAAARELGARDAMCTQLVEKVSVAGHCDVVYISELGCGINRGAMNFGRLYQGKYVPPEREDIVTEEADTEESDDVTDPDTDQNVGQEATIEEIDDDANEKESEQINPAPEAEIDLD